MRVGGMSCAACAKAVERVTKKLDGVKESNVNIATEKAVISYDENKVSLDEINNAIIKAVHSPLKPAYRHCKAPVRPAARCSQARCS